MLHGAVAFDAIARLDPPHAIGVLRNDPLDLRGTESWWMPGLHFRTGARLGSALRQRARDLGSFDAADQLAALYSGHPELMEEDTVDLLLDGLETVLTVDKAPDEDRLRRAWRLLSTLSSARTAATLGRIAARCGTLLEEALAGIGIGRRPNSSRMVDREGEKIARLLAVMAGEGFDRLVLVQLRSPGNTTREYGLGHALWTTSAEVSTELESMALNRGNQEEDRPYHLMQALAAHGRDQGIARLIEESSPVYTHAVDIRQAQSGDSAALAADIRMAVASGGTQERIQAVDLSHFLAAETSFELTAPLIPMAEPGDALAGRLLMLHYQHAHYEPALLPKLLPFLNGTSSTSSVVALHLAVNGDAEGRAASVRWLAEHGLGDSQWRSAQTAFALLADDESRAGAIAFLHRLHERSYHFGRLNADILDALAQHGDAVAQEQLIGLAYGNGTRDLDAVAGAVRIVSREDRLGAYQAARRLFVKSGQQEAAWLLIEADPIEGLTELVTAYVGAPLHRRLSIAWTLRWRAPRDRLLPALDGMARAAEETTRVMAAEIGGWLPHGDRLPWLRDLAGDPVRVLPRSRCRRGVGVRSFRPLGGRAGVAARNRHGRTWSA